MCANLEILELIFFKSECHPDVSINAHKVIIRVFFHDKSLLTSVMYIDHPLLVEKTRVKAVVFIDHCVEAEGFEC